MTTETKSKPIHLGSYTLPGIMIGVAIINVDKVSVTTKYTLTNNVTHKKIGAFENKMDMIPNMPPEGHVLTLEQIIRRAASYLMSRLWEDKDDENIDMVYRAAKMLSQTFVISQSEPIHGEFKDGENVIKWQRVVYNGAIETGFSIGDARKVIAMDEFKDKVIVDKGAFLTLRVDMREENVPSPELMYKLCCRVDF